MKRVCLLPWPRRTSFALCALAIALFAVAPAPSIAAGKKSDAGATVPKGPSAAPEAATYLQDVRPIFMGKCARCHSGETKFMYNWLDYKTAFADRKEIKRRVWDSWKGEYYKPAMPAGNGPECQSISPSERRLIKQWVDAGAAYGSESNDANPKSKGERIEGGKRLFALVCSACHQPDGRGVPNQFPPLAQSDFLNADKNRAIKVLLHGRQGEIVVNGQKFNNSMPSFPLNDDEIASALTFVYSSFGNSGKEVTAEDVKTLRAKQDDDDQKQVVSAPPQGANPFE